MPPRISEHFVSNWFELAGAIDSVSYHWMAFRGQAYADWLLETSFEREFPSGDLTHIERQTMWHFARRAPNLLRPHLIPQRDAQADAWLGLIQHYGGATRFLDVTRSPYIALFFAFEPVGAYPRALWAINTAWCQRACADSSARAEDISREDALARLFGSQAQLVSSLVHGPPYRGPFFETFRPFTGVFPVDPWRPDLRQIAQQALFLCSANLHSGFMANLAALDHAGEYNPEPVTKIIIPGELRAIVLERLGLMNVTAESLFPDLGGLARATRTLSVRRQGGESL